MIKVEKQKRLIRFVCSDGFLIKGYVHINPGERLLDFFNHKMRNYIPVTVVEIGWLRQGGSLKLRSRPIKRESIIINKSAIRWIEEL